MYLNVPPAESATGSIAVCDQLERIQPAARLTCVFHIDCVFLDDSVYFCVARKSCMCAQDGKRCDVEDFHLHAGIMIDDRSRTFHAIFSVLGVEAERYGCLLITLREIATAGDLAKGWENHVGRMEHFGELKSRQAESRVY